MLYFPISQNYTYWLVTFSLAILTWFAQVEVTGQEDVAGSRVRELKGIKLEGVGLVGDELAHWCIGLVFRATVGIGNNY